MVDCENFIHLIIFDRAEFLRVPLQLQVMNAALYTKMQFKLRLQSQIQRSTGKKSKTIPIKKALSGY